MTPEPGVDMGRGHWHHAPCPPSSAVGRHQLAAARKPWPREVGEGKKDRAGERTNCLQAGWRWLCAGQLCPQCLGAGRAGLAGGTLINDAWLQVCSTPQWAGSPSVHCQQKLKISGSSRAALEILLVGDLWRPGREWEAMFSVQPETVFPALALS